MLRVVDVSDAQAGIDASALDCDAVIVKVTGGDYYTNGDWQRQVESALAGGKRIGLYHYARDLHGGYATPETEARRFLDAIAPYIGRCVVALDWEREADAYPISWAREWCEIVERETGSTPLFYAGAGDINSRDFSEVAKYPLWMSSYLFRYDGAGWVEDPLNTWPTGAWDRMSMYQYTSTGRIAGWGGNLDLSVFYGDANDWDALIGGGYMVEDTTRIEAMVNHAIGIANDDSHGYSWADRWSVDRDCSSLMYDSADAAGYPVGRGPDKTRYTGTMIDDFTAAGFAKHDYGSVDLRRGDILLRDPWGEGGHTEMYIGDGMTVGAHSSETGGVYGEPGDQTGNEISIAPNYGNWEYVLRPPADARAASTEEENGMNVIVEHINGTDVMAYFDGHDLHDLSNPDDVAALDKWYREAYGKPMPRVDGGSAEAPWTSRIMQVVRAEAPSKELVGNLYDFEPRS